jgi:hypothetical protein
MIWARTEPCASAQAGATFVTGRVLMSGTMCRCVGTPLRNDILAVIKTKYSLLDLKLKMVYQLITMYNKWL